MSSKGCFSVVAGLNRRGEKGAMMEKGTVRTYDVSCGLGTIARASETDIRFYAESVIWKGHAGLGVGDAVIFEVDNIQNLHIAINVRKI